MKIVIDLQACQSGSRLGGIGRYSLALAKAMLTVGSQHEFVVLLSDLLPEAQVDIRMELADYLPAENITSFAALSGVTSCRPENRLRREVGELLREDAIRRIGADAIHIASFIEGWGDEVLTSLRCKDLAAKTAVTWYDLIPYVSPQMYLSDERIADHYYSKVRQAQNAALWLAISQHSCDEATSVLSRPADSVVNISSAASTFFRPVPIGSGELALLRRRFGIDRSFVMYTGSFDIRKNQAALIRAFASLPLAERSRRQLVLAGNGWSGVYDSLRGVARAQGLPDEQLIFTGHITDEELLTLYNAAELFVFPSMQEGFGLPALEAMCCGTPAIGSDRTSIPEVIGTDAGLFDPTSDTAIRNKMLEVFTQAGLREHLIDHARNHVKNFSWELSAERAISAIEERLGQQTATIVSLPLAFEREIVGAIADVAGIDELSPDEIDSAATAIAANEVRCMNESTRVQRQPRVAWTTTWATRCGIASYAQSLLEHTPGCEHSVLAPLGHDPCDTTLVTRCWQPYHDDLQQLTAAAIARRADIVVLHFNFGFYEPGALNNCVGELIASGMRVMMILHATRDPDQTILARRLVDYHFALQNCDRVFVHSKDDLKNLRAIDIIRNVALLPQGVTSQAEDLPMGTWEVAAAKPFRLATYGFFLPHKGLPQIVEAVAELRDRGVAVELSMINAVYSPEASDACVHDVKTRIASFGLDDQVSLQTEYLEDAESLRLLAECDLIVYPYQNTSESSSAAVRMGLASGQPVAVTPLAIFDDVAAVTSRLPGTTPHEIADGIENLIAQLTGNAQEHRRALAQWQASAERWRKRHSFRLIGEQFSRLICEATAGDRQEASSQSHSTLRRDRQPYLRVA